MNERFKQVVELHPWLEVFKDYLDEKCHDCGAQIGEKHSGGCDTARCSQCHGQHMICGCPNAGPDVWLGLMYLPEHKLCLDKGYWCYDAIYLNGEEFPITSPEMFRLGMRMQFLQFPGFQMKHHLPCKQGDPGAHADLNRAVGETGPKKTLKDWIDSLDD